MDNNEPIARIFHTSPLHAIYLNLEQHNVLLRNNAQEGEEGGCWVRVYQKSNICMLPEAAVVVLNVDRAPANFSLQLSISAYAKAKFAFS
jgi:hypothetical protein